MHFAWLANFGLKRQNHTGCKYISTNRNRHAGLLVLVLRVLGKGQNCPKSPENEFRMWEKTRQVVCISLGYERCLVRSRSVCRNDRSMVLRARPITSRRPP